MRSVCKLLLIFSLFLVGISSFAKGGIPEGVVLKAKEVHYDAIKDSIIATGDIFIQMDKYTLNADKIHYQIKEDVIFAEGNIRIIDDKGKRIYGERAVFKDKLKRGVVEEFVAKLSDDSILASRLANRVDFDHVILEKSVFTPCEINCGNKPIWQINAAHTNIDYNKQKITYKHVLFEVYGRPIMYVPYFAHPTPNAEAQSGFLTPRIKNSDFIVPFYFRAKPNLDFTLAPRHSVVKKHTIFEGEMRHKVKWGQYDVRGSYSKLAFKKLAKAGEEKNARPNRYHVFSEGAFSKNGINYGFELKRASDKAYLINYHDIYDSHLTSKIYTNTVNKRNYFSLEGFSFQDLRSSEDKSDLKIPFVLPNIRTQNIYGLNDEESVLLNIRNNTAIYKELERDIARTSLDLELMSNLITNNGHMLSFTLANRGDLYWTKFIEPVTEREKNKVWARNIPEFRTRWRYPLVKSISSKSSMVIEPTAMVVLGRPYEARFKKFELIDTSENELSENNIFDSNIFSGVDVHDYGKRLSYGLNSSLIAEYLYVNAFFGQRVYKNNVTEKGNFDYVGNINADIDNNFALFYRFRKDKLLNPIRDEVGINIASGKFTTKLMFTALHNVARFFAQEGFNVKNNKISQLNFEANYHLTQSLSIGTSSTLDLAGAPKTLMRSIKMTYLFDCVSINGLITDNFLHDSRRGVKKKRTQSFSVGLKMINM